MSSRSKRLTSLFSLSSSNLSDSGKHSETGSDSGSSSNGRGRALSSADNRKSLGSRLTKTKSRDSLRSVRSSRSSRVHSFPLEDAPPVPKRSPTLNTNPDVLLPPPSLRDPSATRSASPLSSRPVSRASIFPDTPTFLDAPPNDGLLTPQSATSKQSKRKSIFSIGRSNKEEKTAGQSGPLAWVIGHQGKPSYNLDTLLNAEKVPELWDENGDTYIYLFPRTSEKGPSFRVDSSIYAASTVLTQLAYGGIYSSPSFQNGDRKLDDRMQDMNLSQSTPPISPSMSPRATPYMSEADPSEDSSKGSRALSDSLELPKSEIHLHVPLQLSTDSGVPMADGSEPKLNASDIEVLVAARNLFAFLVGQSLVATEKRPSVFSIFLRISDLLKTYEFSNLDGSTFGEIAASSFDNYVEELHLADVRASREKTIEGVVLGEKMRSVMLFNEAFVHAAGKYEQITRLNSPKFSLISQITRNRMERASMDLFIRLKNINERISEFEFPSVFSGIMNSKTSDERKVVRFDAWRKAFLATRSHVISHYKQTYGSWPPKASSKKNTLETSGLNRIVLQDLYRDMSAWYDLLVDRNSLTTRTLDSGSADDEAAESHDPVARALRHVLSEYDRSSPPFQPPIPFDVPILPSLSMTRSDYGTGDAKKDAKARKKDLKDDEMQKMLKASHNEDAEASSPFLDSIRQFEQHASRKKTVDEMCELRVGQWLFMYAVINSLPMVVVDAPGIKWNSGVEYFLCEPPRSGVPWAREDKSTARSWYGIAGSSGVVSLPSDLVEHGVEGVYRRSHCWQMAERWSAEAGGVMAEAVAEDLNEPLPAPGMRRPRPGSRASSHGSRMSQRESVMMLGLEALPLPAGVAPTGEAPRPSTSGGDPTKTFDAIIGAPQKKKGKGSRLAS
ncbi:hypothetical protein K490DRAFT_57120 [Saccharata proteae CBS 121410]|uniref:DUF8004 domain-containing protein n=1 Tax=Saccharata proteae CBS 121410 TaxID=1314787 RepID=A0A9P4LZL3_9PEZI|nr:hypothetical protein K490DRAFT_57120 [Saccharata proteae CBS 121410]